jgi:transcriptional regulator with GAF, ATPase, and Fis domain
MCDHNSLELRVDIVVANVTNVYNEITLRKQRKLVSLVAMTSDIAFKSINELIVRKRPMQETLRAITSQMIGQGEIALARIWLIDKGDICDTCVMRSVCPDQDRCLHLTASEGRNLKGEKVWTGLDGRFGRFPIGVRKVGHVAKSGEAIHLDDLMKRESAWIADPEWIQAERINGIAAHPLKFQDDVLGVIAVFSRKNISKENFEWLRVFAEQASIAIANARAFEEIDKLRQELKDENEYLKEEIGETAQHKFLIGNSPVWTTILQQIEIVGGSEATVLLTGESGTGKEMVARALHEAGGRRDKPLVKVNCAAISSELFESEFFGHVKGAFTGAFKDRIGRFQLADGGTIFLDEIGELPLALQGKLLRVLQEKQFERVGEDRTRTVDVRVIAATNRDLWAEVESGRFRQDLYYRISVFPIHLPPLRERPEDIEPLARHFLDTLAAKNQKASLKLSVDNIKILKGYSFPGNVRELQNIIERALIMSQSSHLNFTMPQIIDRLLIIDNPNVERLDGTDQAIRSYDELKEIERENLITALRATNYRIYGAAGAAELLGIKPTTLISRIKSMEIPMRP